MKNQNQELKSILLKEYKNASETGLMSVRGLCYIGWVMFGEKKELYNSYIKLFQPKALDLYSEGEGLKSRIYWGSDSCDWELCKFTPLRQTILAFIIAMCDE